MSKQYATMKCAVCHRPLARAAALLKGQPVGPVCAAAKGLVNARTAASATGDLFAAPAAHAEPARDIYTLDLFA